MTTRKNPKLTFTFHVSDISVVDGDTLKATLDLGFGLLRKNQVIRLSDIDAPELKSSNPLEKKAALKVKEKLAFVLKSASSVEVASKELDKYGRILGDIRVNGNSVSKLMLDNGLVRKYSGKARKAWSDDELDAVLRSL